ncbi:Helix-loop-helix DNA-binding domain [Musa troglodytarum]|uniref:Helix-loop-helix DNA-binding domain n=2 Tax=Musa troglodytarum TaxID=320322 RepID=A0A9E7I1B3_9LILI|nr:Helix-loop-helix DNA-binding domain [Musa troglodytarum]
MDGAFSSHEEAHQDIILDWAFSPPPPHYPFDLLEPIPFPSMPAKPPPPSAFVKYTASEGTAPSFLCFGDVDSIHRTVNRFLGSLEMAVRPGNSDERAGRSRGFRHMMRERERKEKLSQGYAELHSMLSCTSKGANISIVQSAWERLEELQQAREKLRKRSRELEQMVWEMSRKRRSRRSQWTSRTVRRRWIL